MRLIDADALFRKVKTECNPYGKPTIGFEDGKKVMNWIEQAPTVNGWVSVNDRMPDKIDCYLVALKNHGGIDLDVYHPDINAFNHHRQYVEYWMQIPNLPKEKMHEID